MNDLDPLAALPGPADRRVAARITKDALRQVRSGHPWIFDGSITSVSHDGAAGDLAVVFDDKRKFAAIGLYDPDSPIRIRVLHVGPPRAIDQAHWTERIASALDRRRSLVDDAATTGYRCVHGENDGLPGLVIDRYDETAVVKVYSAAWIPHFRDVVRAFVDLTGVERVVARTSRTVATGPTADLQDGSALVGTLPVGPVTFREHGLAFEADVVRGQKTGHFLDQRENRRLVGERSAGARVLDVFCCTGGFSVHAAAGGASEVHSVDLSQPALDTAKRNMAANRDRPAVAAARHAVTCGDAFEVLESLASRGERYDVVVIDPPSFASRSDQVDRALRAYAHLTRLGLAVVRPGGMLVQSSCSSRIDEQAFHRTIRESATAQGAVLTEWRRTTHAVDHPVGFAEGAYLKTLFATVGR
ncbi:class I SAM-dependent rRNA methyltransferase [Actinospongicola halichondriae]|uniref:class I SAM-dependent rRNA methyltransferase n=1 Tax=Actinospongicola halichondriae TaxID=3236844 RepID=UPI003D373BB3